MCDSPCTGATVPHNAERRSREHLTPDEVEKLTKAAGQVGRHGARDAALIRLTYRHGLRVSEAVALRWDQIDLKQGLVHVNGLKNGVSSTHPLRGPELRSLRQLQRDYPGAYVFATERGGPMTTATVRKLLARSGQLAKLPFPIHPHMLRHACGYKLANEGHDNARATALSRTQEHPAYGALHRTRAKQVQEFLARLTSSRGMGGIPPPRLGMRHAAFDRGCVKTSFSVNHSKIKTLRTR
jgi:integrase